LLEKTVAGNTPWDEKQLGAILDANSAAIQMMQRATRLRECDWGLEFDQGPRASIAYAPRARVLSRLNTLQGMRQMAGGDSQAAVDTWLAGIRFSGHLARGGPLIFTLIGKSMLLPNLRALTTEAQAGHFSAAQKSQITAQLKPLREDIFDWASAWQMEGFGTGSATNQTIFSTYKYYTFWIYGGVQTETVTLAANQLPYVWQQPTVAGIFTITVPPGVWSYFKIPIGSAGGQVPFLPAAAAQTSMTAAGNNYVSWFIPGPNGADETFYVDEVAFVK